MEKNLKITDAEELGEALGINQERKDELNSKMAQKHNEKPFTCWGDEIKAVTEISETEEEYAFMLFCCGYKAADCALNPLTKLLGL